MLFTKVALGVDWSRDGLRLVALGRRFRRLEVLGWLELQDPAEGGAQDKVQNFLKKHRIREARANACLPRELLFVRFLELPKEAESHLAQVIGYQLETLNPFRGSAVYWDTAVVARDVGTKQIRVMVVIAEKDRVDGHYELLKKLGLRVGSLTLAAASLASLFGGSLPEAALVVLGRTSEVELLAFARGRIVAAREVSAENGGSAVEQFERELHGLRSLVPLPELSELATFICGPVPPALSEALGAAKALELAKPSVALPREFDPVGTLLPAVATAYAALRPKSDPSVNLLPRERRWRPSRGVRLPIYALASTACAMGLILAGRGSIERALYGVALDRQIHRLSSQAETARRTSQQVAALTQQAELLEGLRTATWRRLQVLEELTRLLPDGTWVQDVQVGENSVEFGGYSNRTADLIQPLENSPRFSRVELASPITGDAQKREIFRIRMRLGKPGVP